MTTKLTTLDNGFRIITDHMQHVGTSACGIWIGSGARDETVQENGISHFLEHMLFKGTETKTALELAEFVEDRGGRQNAFTDYDVTAYFSETTDQYTTESCDLITDMVLNSTFPDDELELERGVVIQEIGRYGDDPSAVCDDLLRVTTFADQSLGRPILGPKENVLAFSADDLKNRIKSYDPSLLVLVASGNVNHDQMVELGNKYYGSLERKPVRTREKPKCIGGIVHQHDDSEQMHYRVAIESVERGHRLQYAFKHLSCILGHGMTSRLFQEIREKRGLVYSVYAYGEAGNDYGLLNIGAGTSPERIDEFTTVLFNELMKLSDGVTEKELARSKASMLFSLSKGSESTMGRADSIARYLLNTGEVYSREYVMSKVNNVTVDEVKEVAGLVLSNINTLTVATVGPNPGNIQNIVEGIIR